MERKNSETRKKGKPHYFSKRKNRYASIEPYSGETYISEHFTSGEPITKIIGEKK